MTYLPEPVVSLMVERESRIIYRSKDNRQEKTFDALDWLAAMTSHVGFKNCLGEEDIYQGISISSS